MEEQVMPDILIRDVSEAAAAAIRTRAAAAGQNQQQYLTSLIEELVDQPVVKASYKLRAIGPGEAHAVIGRWRDGLNARGAANMSQEQADAYKRTILLVERNGPGDREAAIGLLKSAFEDVFEVAG
jgi:hypothetical protein